MNIKRTTFIITQKCSLKCKLCLAFVPYFEKPRHTSYEEAVVIVDNYFSMVESVGTFSVTGGEPLLNPDFVRIMKYVLEYRNQITDTLDFVTNGTIMFSDVLLDLLHDNNDKIRVIISDYGTKLSTKIKQIEDALINREINYRIQNYNPESDEWTYDGWVDFSDHSLKHIGEAEMRKQALRCLFRRGHYWVINDGRMHPCSRQYWRMHIGVLDDDDEWYIDLNNLEIDYKIETQKIKKLEQAEYLLSCAYCNGCYNGIERHKPAEQLI